MTTLRTLSTLLATSVVAISLAGCGSMSSRDRSTAIGAGVGALGGAVLGGTAATIGGAAVGGVIGNQMGKDNARIH
ncbi:MAG: osmotically-inducible lipoprotein B [Acidobacteriota bacterium]